MKRRASISILASALVASAFLACFERDAAAITRDEVIVHAKAFAYHPWRCTQANLTASCSSAYKSEYLVGDYVGLPYDWGGYMSLFEFDQQIAQGYGAGSYPADDVLDCTSGLDCSGFVSKCWDTGHWSTSTLDQVSDAIDASEVLAGDVFNKAGYHVVMFSHELANGTPVFYEAIGYNTHINASTGYSWVSGFTPRRFQGIEGTTAGDPVGTITRPIVISSFPYNDDRNTTTSSSDVFDGCGAAPGTAESGPEFVYQVTFTQPGTLTASVSDDVGVDIDIHLYTSANTNDCVARDDSAITVPVDCGTYYLVADTFGAGDTNAGAYSLTVNFTPSGQSCGAGPSGYDPSGGLGDSCAFPGHEELPFCNENLGAETCIYTQSSPIVSFCSKACTTASDCNAFPGGCCEDIGNGELYCLESSLCGSAPADSGVADSHVDPDAAPVDAGGDASAPTPDGAGGQPGEDGGSADGTVAPDDDAASPTDDAGSSAAPPAATPDDGGCSCRTSDRNVALSWLGGMAGIVALQLLRTRRRQ